MKFVPRLLPAVIVVGLALLGLKGEGLVRTAWAEGDNASATSDVLAKDSAPVATDAATEDPRTESAAEVDVLSSLAKRRAALDARESDLDLRTQVLSAAEARVDSKIAALRLLQDQIQTLLGQRDDAEKAQLAALVKTYSAMKPKDAARIFNSLSDDVLVAVAQAMKADVLAPILAAMTADNAQKLTLKLANRLKVPDTAAAVLTQAAAPIAAATPAAPQQATPAPVAPQQEASPAAPAPEPAKPAPRKPRQRTAAATPHRTAAPPSTTAAAPAPTTAPAAANTPAPIQTTTPPAATPAPVQPAMPPAATVPAQAGAAQTAPNAK